MLHYQQVLSCVGVNTGPTHLEIRCTPKGPCLIELGARLEGGISPRSVYSATGLNPIITTVESYVRPEKALIKLKQKRLLKYARHVYFHSDVSGIVKHKPELKDFYKLPSMHEIILLIKVGDMLYETDKIPGRQGYAYLIHVDLLVLERDYKHFLILEKELYKKLI